MDSIEKLLKERGLTKAALAEKMGVKSQNVNSLLNNPTRATLEKIAIALDIPMWQLFATPEEAKGADADSIQCPV